MLFDAMGAVDATTGLPRGYLRLSAQERPDSVLFTLDVRDGPWRAAEEFVRTGTSAAVQVGEYWKEY